MTPDRPDFSKVRLVQPPQKPKSERLVKTYFLMPDDEAPPGAPFPSDIELTAGTHAVIQIRQGHRELARHFAQRDVDIPAVPVIIKARIVDSVTTHPEGPFEFLIEIDAIEQDHSSRTATGAAQIPDNRSAVDDIPA